MLGNNNERDHSYFSFMNPFLSFKNKVFFSGEKLESYCYVVISVVFVHYLVSHSAYIFLYVFLSNFNLFDNLLGKGWWYTSSVTTIISLECIWLPIPSQLCFLMRRVLQQQWQYYFHLVYQSISSFEHLFHFSSDFSIYQVNFSLLSLESSVSPSILFSSF